LAARVRELGLQLGLPAPGHEAIEKTIYRVERGDTNRPGDDFYRPVLARALDADPQELFPEPPRPEKALPSRTTPVSLEHVAQRASRIAEELSEVLRLLAVLLGKQG
jgi:hypothetical protein